MKLFNPCSINASKLHTKYKLLREAIFYDGERKVLQEWADGFEDRDGKGLIEFKTTFHSMFWEFYIHQILKEMGEKIDWSKNRPDFIVKNEDGTDKMYIEAVVSQIKKDGRSEETRDSNDAMTTIRPLWKLDDFENIINEGVVRASNSIQTKLKKYEEYIRLDWVASDVPYIVALSSYSQVNYGLESHYSIMALLYGLYLSDNGLDFFKKSKILKPNTESEIALNIFNDEKYSDISAVMFSSKVTIGKLAHMAKSKNLNNTKLSAHINVYQDDSPPFFKALKINPNNPELLEDGLIVFHNPKAKNPLDKKIFEKKGVMQIFCEDGKLEIDTVSPFLINRYHHTHMQNLEDMLIQMFHVDYNHEDEELVAYDSSLINMR